MTSKITILVGGDFSVPSSQVVDESIWDDKLQQIVKESDLTMVNLEGPLTASTSGRPKIGVHLKGEPDIASILKKSGVDYVSLANNHIFDYEEIGVQDTMQHLQQAGIEYAGIRLPGETPIKYVQIKGKTIGFYHIAEHEFNYKDDTSLMTGMLEPARNILDIQEVRKKCDALLLFCHIGPEHTSYPSPRMVSLFRCFVEAGATAVINCHAHQVMGMEKYHGAPIVYGLGNLLFYSNAMRKEWYQGMMAKININEDCSVDCTPLFTKFTTQKSKIYLDETQERQSDFEKISSILDSSKELDDKWHEFCVSQRQHILKEMAKGALAMLPCALQRKLFGHSNSVKPNSYFAKGARMLRGMFQCENHADVLARIFRDISNGE